MRIPNGAQTTTISQSYGYDSLNRLTSAQESVSSVVRWTQTYGYDRMGNRTSLVNTGSEGGVLPTQSTPAVNGATNRLTAYGYDESGNVTTDATGNTLGYDAENRMVSFVSGSSTSTYVYDGDGRRVKKVVGTTTTIFVYNASGQLVAEYGQPQGEGGTRYLTSDHLGSTRVVTDATGAVKARHDYLPFGEEIGSSIGGRQNVTGYSSFDSTRQRFSAKERDTESGLDYFLARYYSSAQGRFTSVDPANESVRLDNPQTLNRYSYTLNNPLRYVDPDGQIPVETAIDVLSFAESFYELIKNPSWSALGYVLWDAASIVIPYAPGSWVAKVGKYGYRGLEAAGIIKALDALETVANNTYIKKGVALLGQGDDSVRKALGIPEREAAADFLGVNQQGKYFIGEAKGSDVGHAVEQIQNTANHLLKADPNATVKRAEIILQKGQEIDRGYSVNGNRLQKFNSGTWKWEDVKVQVGKKLKAVQVRYVEVPKDLRKLPNTR
jgi:RHS repeat-associated protein